MSHRLDQTGAGEGFPLHHNDRAARAEGDVDSDVETAPACAEADGSQFGMKTHTAYPFASSAATRSRVAFSRALRWPSGMPVKTG